MLRPKSRSVAAVTRDSASHRDIVRYRSRPAPVPIRIGRYPCCGTIFDTLGKTYERSRTTANDTHDGLYKHFTTDRVLIYVVHDCFHRLSFVVFNDESVSICRCFHPVRNGFLGS